MNVLVSRPDRIGDVVLSTPVFRALKRARPAARVTVLVRAAVVPILEGLTSIDELIVLEPTAHRGLAGVRSLARELGARRFAAFVALFSDATVAAAAFAAGIPVRIGPRSRPHSFLFYNRGVRQRRSRVAKHEAEYNLDLLRPLGIDVPPRSIFPEIAVSAAARRDAAEWLQAHAGGEACGWIAIHPGMGGSALNWPESHYFALAAALRGAGERVLVTAGPQDTGVTARARATLGEAGVACYEAAGGIDLLAALYERMDLVIAPSTGPLHLAAATGTPVLSFYPNIRVQSVARWGPYIADPALAAVLEPDLDCGSEPDCMRSITVEAALREARRLIRLRRERR